MAVEILERATVRKAEILGTVRLAVASGDCRSVIATTTVRSQRHDPTLPLSSALPMMPARTMYAGGMRATAGFRLGRETFVAPLTPTTIALRDDRKVAEDYITRFPLPVKLG